MSNTSIFYDPLIQRGFLMTSQLNIPPSSSPLLSKITLNSPPTQMSAEAQEILKAINNLTEVLSKHMAQSADQFTFSLAKNLENKAAEAAEKVAKDAEKAKKEAEKIVEQEIAQGERRWFAIPKMFQTNSTLLRDTMASAFRTALRNTTLLAAPMAPFIRNTPLLAVAPATLGAYTFISRKLANNEIRWWMRKIGPKSTVGDYVNHSYMQQQANRETKIKAATLPKTIQVSAPFLAAIPPLLGIYHFASKQLSNDGIQGLFKILKLRS
jgi:hypothetical protein